MYPRIVQNYQQQLMPLQDSRDKLAGKVQESNISFSGLSCISRVRRQKKVPGADSPLSTATRNLEAPSGTRVLSKSLIFIKK